MMDVTPLIIGVLLPVCAGVLLKKWICRSHAVVNCWFCNNKNSVAISDINQWICSHCEQYNGFLPDGDYNRDIQAQWDPALNTKLAFTSPSNAKSLAYDNGLCSECNRNQEKIVAMLASFQPSNPRYYDSEIKHFQENLERVYRLCTRCEIVLDETLARKKTLILDSNLKLSGSTAGHGKHPFKKMHYRKGASEICTLLTFIVAVIFSISLSLLPTVGKSSDPIYKTTSVPLKSDACPKSSLSQFLAALEPCPALTFVESHNYLNDATSLEYWEGFHSFDQFSLATYGLAFQILITVFSRRYGILLLWAAQFISLYFQPHIMVVSSNLHQIQVLLSWIIVVLSLIGVHHHKTVAVVPLKRLGSHSKRKQTLQTPIPKFGAEDSCFGLMTACSQKSNELSFSTAAASSPVSQNYVPPQLSNYMTVQSKVPIHQELTLPNLDCGTNSASISEHQCSFSQEDARSDASVDSAFSNSDSTIPDVADLDCDKEDAEVQSLIGSLTLGTRRSRNSSGHVFQTRRFSKNRMKKEYLKPSKLDNVLNDSWNSSLWSSRSGKLDLSFPPIDTTFNRSVSPCRSVCSQVTHRSLSSEPTFPSSVPQSTWNQSPIHPTVVQPHSTFGSHAIFSNPHFPQVVYTSYGMNHQPNLLWNSACMMSPQSPFYLQNASPPGAGLTMFPKSYVSARCRNGSEYNLDAAFDLSQSYNSTHSNVNASVSSTFVDSIWQSRSIIFYTSMFYVLVGCVAFGFYYRRWFGNYLTSIV